MKRLRIQLLTHLRTGAVVFLAGLVAFNAVNMPAYAIGPNDLNSLNNNTPFYDATDAQCIGSGGTTQLTDGDAVKQAFDYLLGKGLSPIAAAGIVGNLMEESGGVTPRIVQGGLGNDGATHPRTFSDTIPGYAIGKLGYGIAQWTSSGRQRDLIAWAAKSGKGVSDLGVQLDYLWSEATTTYNATLDKTKAAGSIDSATEIWMLGFESPDPALAHLKDVRIPDAQQAWEKYHNDASTSVAATNALCGQSSNFASNFVFYKQCDNYPGSLSTQAERDAAKAWSGALYGKAADKNFNTVCNQGCGVTAMAMIITNLTGQIVTPDKTAAYGQANGTADPGGDGSLGDQLGPVLGGHWGLKSEPIPNFNIDKINQTLRNGGLVLAGGHMESHYYQGDADPHSTPFGPFSVGGHFIVIRAITSDGKWLVGNPGGWSNDTQYDPNWVLAHTTVHNAWAITKG